MKLLHIALVVVLGALSQPAVAAPAAGVAIDASPEFKGYRTFTWVFQTRPAAADPAVYENIKQSIEKQLNQKGYRLADAGDMAVAFTVGRRERIEKQDWGAYGGDIYSRLGVTPAMEGETGRQVSDGTLAIEVYDAQTKQPVWRATVVKELPRRGATRSLVDNAVAGALKDLPPAK